MKPNCPILIFTPEAKAGRSSSASVLAPESTTENLYRAKTSAVTAKYRLSGNSVIVFGIKRDSITVTEIKAAFSGVPDCEYDAIFLDPKMVTAAIDRRGWNHKVYLCVANDAAGIACPIGTVHSSEHSLEC